MPGTDYIPEQGVWFQMKYLSGEMKILSSLLLIAIIKDKPNVKLGSMHVDVLCHECSVVITISLCEWPQPSSNFNHPINYVTVSAKWSEYHLETIWKKKNKKNKQKKQKFNSVVVIVCSRPQFSTVTHTHTHTHTTLSLTRWKQYHLCCRSR